LHRLAGFIATDGDNGNNGTSAAVLQRGDDVWPGTAVQDDRRWLSDGADVGEQQLSDVEQQLSDVGERQLSDVGEQQLSDVGEQQLSDVGEQQLSDVGEQQLSDVGE
jgi:uncharacterized protein YjiS (DUF1127 family)